MATKFGESEDKIGYNCTDVRYLRDWRI